MDIKRADPDLQLDVDLMILEYLLYNTTRVLLQIRKNQANGQVAEAHEAPEPLLVAVDCKSALGSLQTEISLTVVSSLFGHFPLQSSCV